MLLGGNLQPEKQKAMDELFQYYKAICRIKYTPIPGTDPVILKPTSDHHTYTSIPIPATLTPRPHMHIVNLDCFVSTQLTRLESESRKLRYLAAANLMALRNTLESITTEQSK